MKKLLLLATAALWGLSSLAAEGDITVPITTSTGTAYHSNGNASTAYFTKWISNQTSADIPPVTFYVKSGQNQAVIQNGAMNLYGYGSANAGTYVFTAPSVKYYISNISFTATAKESANTVKSSLSTTAINLPLNVATPISFDYPNNESEINFYMSVAKPVVFTDFQVTLTPVTTADVESDSWYVIKSLTVAQNKLAGLNPYGVYRHSNGDYSMSWHEFTGSDYSTVSPDCYVYVEEVNSTKSQMVIRSNNGMYMNNDGTADREPQQTNITIISPADGYVRIGGTWSTFNQTINVDGTSVANVGLGQSGNAANNFIMTKVDPSERFDIWTVNILKSINHVDASFTTSPFNDMVKEDVQVAIESDQNHGWASVYNGGKFFLTKGYTPVFDDLRPQENMGNSNPEIIIDAATKTISVDYNKMHGQAMDWNARLEKFKSENTSVLNDAIAYLTANGFTEADVRTMWANVTVGNTEGLTDDEQFALFETASHRVEYFLSEEAIPAFLSSIDGKKIKLRATRTENPATSTNASYSYMKGLAANTVNSAATLDVQSVWDIEVIDAKKAKIHNIALDKYVSMGSADNSQANLVDASAATTFSVEFITSKAATHPGHVAFAVDGSNNGMHLASNGSVISWGKAAGADQWIIELVDDTDEQGFITAATTAINSLPTISAQPGAYSYTDAEIGATIEEIKTGIASWTPETFDYNKCYIATNAASYNKTLNPVTPGHFVRIKSNGYNESGNAYALGMNGTNYVPWFTNDKDQSILYFNAGNNASKGYLSSYKNGYVIQQSGGMLSAKTSASTDGLIPAGAVEVWFDHTATAPAQRGRFYLKYMNGSETRFSYNANAEGAPNGGKNVTSTSSANYTFEVDYVTSLPVALNGQHIGSIICPMAVDVPSDCKAWVAEVDNHEIVWAPATYIPANAHAIIYAPNDNGKVYVTVSENQTASTSDVSEHLKGHHLTMAHNAADVNLYALDVNGMSVDGDDSVTEPVGVTLSKVSGTGNITVPPSTFAVHVTNPAASASESLSLPFDKAIDLSTGTTGIEEVGVKSIEAVYDLQGRKLAQPAKGINIIGGRKVLVK